MKLKKIILTFAVLVAALTSTVFSACDNLQGSGQQGNDNLQSHVQQLNYAESTEKINNPDQGFYRPIFVRMTESGVSYNKGIINSSTRLYHLRIDISAFSAAVNNESDKLLNQTALDGLQELLSYLKERDKNSIVRFAYDAYYNGGKDKEPALPIILEHIKQVCPVLNRFENTVTAVEAGLIGPWGEMHSSAIANAANITPIIEAFLANAENIPILVRTPKMIYDYLGITLNDIDNYTISAEQKAYRLGLYNDGYLGSGNDLGTYSDRQREIEFLSRQTDHLPFGGEIVIPSSNLHDIDVCLPEMHKINLSYLNVEWNNQVIDKWKNSTYTKECGTDEIYYGKTAFNYIENRMGYRFILTNSVFKYADKLDKFQAEISLNNVGFGNLNRTKHAKLIILNESGEVAFSQDLQDFTGEKSYNFSTNLSLLSGKYGVYLRLYGEEAEGTPLYCLQFANEGLWNADLKANKIGELEI